MPQAAAACGRVGRACACARRYAVVAQDLTAQSHARNVTAQVRWDTLACGLTLSGATIADVGREGRSSDSDVSPPGLVLRVVRA